MPYKNIEDKRAEGRRQSVNYFKERWNKDLKFTEDRKQRLKEWQQKNKEHVIAYRKEYNRLHPRILTVEAKQEMRKYGLKRRLELKMTVINHYGGKCYCCGETGLHFLTISHVNNDGKKHRETLQSKNFYYWLIQNNFQTEYQLQVECWNCNLARRCNGGICPHKEIRVR